MHQYSVCITNMREHFLGCCAAMYINLISTSEMMFVYQAKYLIVSMKV